MKSSLLRAFLACVPKVAEIDPPGLRFLAFLAMVPKVSEIELLGRDLRTFLAWVPKGPKTSKTREGWLKQAWRSQNLKNAKRSA